MASPNPKPNSEFQERYNRLRQDLLAEDNQESTAPEKSSPIEAPDFQERYKKLRSELTGQPVDEAPPPLLVNDKTPKGEEVGWDRMHNYLRDLAGRATERFKDKPPVYTSGYRSQGEQDALPVAGKATVSRHTGGKAFDERIKDLTPDEIRERIDFYNSHPGVRSSVHNGNHIHTELHEEPVDYADPKVQARLERLGLKPGSAKQESSSQGVELSPEEADTFSKRFSESDFVQKQQDANKGATLVNPPAVPSAPPAALKKFADEWLQPDSDKTFEDVPVIPPQLTKYLKYLINPALLPLPGVPEKENRQSFLEKTLGKVKDVQQGVGESVDENVSGLITPKSLATGAALSTPAAPYLLAAMTPEMLKSTYESGKRSIESIQQGDTKESAKNIMNTLVSALMTYGGAKGSVKGIKGDLQAIRGKGTPEGIPPEVAPESPVKPERAEPVYLGSGLGGLQKFIEKDPAVVARQQKLKEIEAQAKRTGKKLHEAMDDVTDRFDPELYADVMTRQREIAGEAGKIGLKESLSKFYGEVKSKLIDSNAPIEDLLARSEKKYNFRVTPEAHITPQIDRVLRSPTLAGQFAKDFGIEKVIKDAPDLNRLDQYLIARQAKDVEARGVNTGRNLAKDEALVQAFAPTYEPYAKAVNEYSRKLLDYSVESGLIPSEIATQLKELYPNYVPINRVFTELERETLTHGQTKAVTSLSKQTILQRLKGSDREIESPIVSLLSKTNDAFLQGEKNKAGKILAMYKDLPGFEGKIRELAPNEKAKYTFSYLEDGAKRRFETTQEIAAAAKALNVQQLNILGKIFAFPVRLAKIGITGYNIPFTASNLIRDQFTVMINGGNLSNPRIFLKALGEAVGGSITHNKLYQEMVREGGGGTSYDVARNQAPLTIERIRSKKSIGSRVKYIARHPLQLLNAVEDIISRSEEVTRLQQYQGTKQALLKEGRTLKDAKILGTQAARENSANFLRRGEWGTVLNSAFLYLNAAKEGSRAFLRAARRNPLSTAAKVATVVYLPTTLTTLWNLSDPERRKAYLDVLEYEKQGNLIYIPRNPTKDEKGHWNVIKIPIAPGIGKLSIPLRRMIEQMYGLDPVKFSEVAKAVIGSMSPVEPEANALASTFTPQGIKPIIEGYANYDFYRDAPIVPPKLQGLSPELQVKPYTSGTARKIGKLLNVSPIKAEQFIKSTLGGLGAQGLNASDRVLAATGSIPKDQIGGQSISEGIIGRFTKARGGRTEQREVESVKPYVQAQENKKAEIKNESDKLMQTLPGMSKEQRISTLRSVANFQPEVYERLMKAVEDKETKLSYSESLVKQLSASDGTRARYIFDQIKAIKDSDARKSFIKKLYDKDLINEEIQEQLAEMAATEKSLKGMKTFGIEGR